MLPVGRSFFRPIPNSNPEPAGQVSMMLFPVTKSGLRKITVISCTGSKWSVPAAEAISGMFLKTGLPHPANVTASIPFLSVSRRKKKQERKINRWGNRRNWKKRAVIKNK